MKYRITINRMGSVITFYFKHKVIRNICFWLLKNHHDQNTQIFKWIWRF